MNRTKFYNCHKNLNAKLVNFAGFEMPIQYTSIISEHRSVRNSVGVFDVSHMGEIIVKGNNALDFIQFVTVNNAARLDNGKVQYSAMCNEGGGIVDDLLVYRLNENEYMLVVNGANREKDFAWMKKYNSFGVEIFDESDDYSLLAVQGPKSREVIEKLFGQTIDIEYYTFININLFEVNIILSRTGYTGELGYELYFKSTSEIAEKVWNELFEVGKEYGITPVGLGCRDSLRLEMGFCLYGNDIDESTTPLEAGLGWITKLKKGDFVGREALLNQREKGINKKLIPLIFDEKAFPRKGYEIEKEGKVIGKITSGTVSPILEKPIAMGYVDTSMSTEGESLDVVIRGKAVQAKIIKLPFIEK